MKWPSILLALPAAALLTLGSACREAPVERGGARPAPPEPAADPGASTELAGTAPAGAAVTQEALPAEREAAVAPPLPPQMRVVLVAEDTGGAVPGAEVQLIGYAEFERALESAQDAPAGIDIDEIVTRLGHREQADSAGELRLARPATPLLVVARTETLWGCNVLVPDGPSQLRIELEHSPTLRVRVIDDRGRARAGVPVALRLGVSGHRTWHFRTVVSRAPDGRADFPHLPSLIDSDMRRGLEDGGLFVTLVTPGASAPEVELDYLDPPSKVIDLRIPPCGDLEVRLLDECGLPIATAGGVLLTVLREAESYPSRNPSDLSFAALEGESALVPCVGLAQRFLVAVSTRDHERASQVVEGPLSPGERVTVSVTLGARLPRLTGHFVDEGGAPVSSRELTLQVRGSGRVFPVTTAQDGSFVLPLKPPDGSLTQLLVSSELVPSERSVGGAFPVTPPSASGTMDLGRLVLRPHPLLVSGSVVWQDGEPAREARLHLMGRITGKGSGWGDDTLYLDADHDGRFAAYGFVDGPCELLVETNHDEAGDSAVVKVRPGATDVTLVLTRMASVVGRLLLDEAVSVDDLSLGLSGEGADPSTYHDGTFRLFQVPPGVYTFRVWFDEGGLLGEVPNVVVTEGATVRDPRLDPLDLRGRARSIVVRVGDGEGRPIHGATLAWRFPGAEEWREPLPMKRGRKTLLFAGSAVDLRVEAPGCLPVERAGVGVDLELVLEPEPQAGG